MKLLIKKDKSIMGGQWCLEGTRIPVAYMIDYEKEFGNNWFKEFIKSYPWTEELFKVRK